MNDEQNRLATFNDWPTDAQVSAQRIAKAGFFYTKYNLQVECFSCGIRISEWNYGDQVMGKHRILNPECPFVLSSVSSGNVPLNILPSSSSTTSSEFVHDYKNETVRLASFENWPIPEIVRPVDLAKAGFYSLKKEDNTKCAYCKGVVRAWEPNDIPDIEHKKHFPSCPFVLSTINPRLDGNNAGGGSSGLNFNVKNINHINNVVVDGNLDELGVQKHNGPKRPDYGTVESRLKSFNSWSPNLIQTPDILAQAGFYYEGMGDQVRCFHCDGGLRHWDPDDDPWTEHARWFPRCSFVNLVKGQEFVAACSLDHVNDVGNDEQQQQIQKIKRIKKRKPVSDEELRAHLNSEAALAALGIGIDVQRVRRAMKEKLELTGEGYLQPDALVEAALNVQLEEADDGLDSIQTNNQISDNVAAILSDLTKRSSSSSSSSSSNVLSYNDPVVKFQQLPPNSEHHQHHAGNSDGTIIINKLLTGDGNNQGDSNNTRLNKSISLEEENRLLKEARLCKICMDSEVGIVFLPCGHLATCVNCAPNLEDCPVCRSTIKATVRTFLS